MKDEELKALKVLGKRMGRTTKALLLMDLAPPKTRAGWQIAPLTEWAETLVSACLAEAKKKRWRNMLSAAQVLGMDSDHEQ